MRYLILTIDSLEKFPLAKKGTILTETIIEGEYYKYRYRLDGVEYSNCRSPITKYVPFIRYLTSLETIRLLRTR